MIKKILYLFLFFLSPALIAQTLHDGLEFSRTEFNFPKKENWVSLIDTVEVKNNTSKKIFLLKQKYPREFEVRFPASGIDPGQTVFLEIVYKPSDIGKFNSSFQLYHSGSQTPLTFTYKGQVISFDEFATVACPSFSKPNLKPVDFDMEITVIDSVTKKPLANSFLEITKGELYHQYKTDINGYFTQKASIYYYVVLAEHTGYKGRWVAKHINPKNRRITIALPPLKELQSIPIPVPVIPVPPAKDSIIIAKNEVPLPLSLPIKKSDFSIADYKKNNIIFLIDKSSSMNKPDCMPLLQMAMTQLANMTRPEDRITIITYANEAKVVMPGTSGDQHEKITGIIQQLKCGGRTEGGKAIHTAYENAEKNFIKGGINQIIIATDGGFNGISENEEELMQLVGKKSKEEIKLSVLAFGENRYGKAHITRLAKQGEGFYVFIANTEDATKKLTETIMIQSKIK